MQAKKCASTLKITLNDPLSIIEKAALNIIELEHRLKENNARLESLEPEKVIKDALDALIIGAIDKIYQEALVLHDTMGPTNTSSLKKILDLCNNYRTAIKQNAIIHVETLSLQEEHNETAKKLLSSLQSIIRAHYINQDKLAKIPAKTLIQYDIDRTELLRKQNNPTPGEKLTSILSDYLHKRTNVLDKQGHTLEYYYSILFFPWQCSYTQKATAVTTLIKVLEGTFTGEAQALTQQLHVFRNGELGKKIRAFVKAGHADVLAGKEVRTVSDFIAALADKQRVRPNLLRSVLLNQ